MLDITRRAFMEFGSAFVLVRGKKARADGGQDIAPDHAELAYGTNRKHRLDIYLPLQAGPHPFVIAIHGGGFHTGDKAGKPVNTAVLDAGIAVVRINYRLSGTDLWPAQLMDCLAAVDFLRAEGQGLDLDLSRMALWGQSAGAFLAVSTALSLVEAGQPPRAVVDFYGPSDLSTLDDDMGELGPSRKRAALAEEESFQSRLLGYSIARNRDKAYAVGPVGRLNQMQGLRLPPLMIRHGDRDRVISDTQSARLRDAWVAADPLAEVDFASVKGAGHGGAAFEAPDVQDDLVAFLQRHLI